MMNKYSIVFTAFLLYGCHPSETAVSPSQPDVNASAANQDIANSPDQNKGAHMILPQELMDNKVHLYFRERKQDNIAPFYEQARKIVESEKHITDEIQAISRRVNQYFILGFPADPVNAPRGLDMPSQTADKYLVVDLQNQKLISPNDFDSVFNLYQSLDLPHHTPDSNPDKEQEFINAVASITSAVAFHTSELMSTFIEGQNFPGDVGPASLIVGDKEATLTYFINKTAMRELFVKCQLTCSDTKCVFTTENITP